MPMRGASTPGANIAQAISICSAVIAISAGQIAGACGMDLEPEGADDSIRFYKGARMAGGISVHAVDVARGRPAQGMQVDIYDLEGVRKLIASGKLGASGALDHPVVQGEGVKPGPYQVIFH